MKRLYVTLLLIASTCLLFQSCEDYFNPELGKDYDIVWPVPFIEITLDSLTVDTEYTFNGEDLGKVFQVFFGTDQAGIIDTVPNSITIKTPRIFDRSKITLRNYYNYYFESELPVIPRFLPATISQWPESFRRGQTITLEGENVDQLEVLIINNIRVPVNGRAIEDKTYKRIIIPVSEVDLEPTVRKVLLKAIGLDGSFHQASDSTAVN